MKRSRRSTPRVIAFSLPMAITASLAACVPSPAPGPAAPIPDAPAVVTFEVAEQGTYSVELRTRELVTHVVALMDGSEEGRIPIGRIAPGDGGVNAPWSWHIDPATLEFADVTTEVCDGLPQYIEDGTLTSEWYCPWDAKVVALEELPTDG